MKVFQVLLLNFGLSQMKFLTFFSFLLFQFSYLDEVLELWTLRVDVLTHQQYVWALLKSLSFYLMISMTFNLLCLMKLINLFYWYEKCFKVGIFHFLFCQGLIRTLYLYKSTYVSIAWFELTFSTLKCLFIPFHFLNLPGISISPFDSSYCIIRVQA